MTNQMVAPVSYGQRMRDLTHAHPDAPAIYFEAIDGSERVVSWSELDRRSNQIARLMERRGVAYGGRVAVELRNSPELVEVIAAAWKVGAVPVPMRWNLPEWERQRLLEVIDPKWAIGAGDLDVLAATTDESEDALPDVMPAQTHGICSSGSTGIPKVILVERPAAWTRGIRAVRLLMGGRSPTAGRPRARAALSHQRVRDAAQPARWRRPRPP